MWWVISPAIFVSFLLLFFSVWMIPYLLSPSFSYRVPSIRDASPSLFHDSNIVTSEFKSNSSSSDCRNTIVFGPKETSRDFIENPSWMWWVISSAIFISFLLLFFSVWMIPYLLSPSFSYRVVPLRSWRLSVLVPWFKYRHIGIQEQFVFVGLSEHNCIRPKETSRNFINELSALSLSYLFWSLSSFRHRSFLPSTKMFLHVLVICMVAYRYLKSQ